MVRKSIEHILRDGLKIIEERDYNNPFLDVQIILSYLLKKDKIYLHLNKDEILEDEIIEKFFDLVKKRNSGYPLQYIINEQEFMGINFYVQKGVLIPRPDTEILVEKIINIVNNNLLKNKEINIIDIGTGSGAIAVSLAHYLKEANIIAIDISDIALETANINAKRHSISNITIKKGDLFGDLNIADGKFDIIVSNPPYIETDEIKKLQKEVSIFEPKEALDGGEDGLHFYRKIMDKFIEHSTKKSILSVEIGYNQGKEVKEIFSNSNVFNNIEIDKDLSGNDRVVTGYCGI